MFVLYSHLHVCLCYTLTCSCRNICEAILRNRPENVLAAELHTASISAKDDADEKKVKQIAVGGTVAVAALGVATLILGAAGKKRS